MRKMEINHQNITAECLLWGRGFGNKHMQEEKDYYLYIDDMFRQCDWMKASSELYIDLTKEFDQIALPI